VAAESSIKQARAVKVNWKRSRQREISESITGAQLIRWRGPERVAEGEL